MTTSPSEDQPLPSLSSTVIAAAIPDAFSLSTRAESAEPEVPGRLPLALSAFSLTLLPSHLSSSVPLPFAVITVLVVTPFVRLTTKLAGCGCCRSSTVTIC